MDQTRRALRLPRLPRRALLSLLSLALLATLLFTAHAVLAQPPALPPAMPPLDAPWTVPNVKVNIASAGNITTNLSYAPYAAIAAFGGTTTLVSAWISNTGIGFDDLMFARSANGGASWLGQTRISTGTVGLPDVASPALALAVTGTQTVHAAWLKKGASDHTLYYKRSDNGGVTWPLTDTVVEASPFGMGGPAYSPDLTVSGNSVYYVWEANNQIKLARSTSSGSSWLTPTSVYTTSTALLWYNLSLAAGPTGTLHLVWDQNTGGSGMDLCYIRSTTSGLSWSAPTCPVNLPFSYTPTDPDLAIDPADGSLHLVYLADVGRIPKVMHKYSTDGGVNWSPPITVSDSLLGATEPGIAISGTQKIYVSWTE
jgi:hypothetical protein